MSEVHATDLQTAGADQSPDNVRRDAALAAWLFVLAASVYLLGVRGACGSDGQASFQTAYAIARHGNIAVPPGTVSTLPGRYGRWYSMYGILQPLAAAPLCAAGAAAGALLHQDAAAMAQVAASCLNPLITALVVVLVFVAARGLGSERTTAVWVALIYAFVTPAWFNATLFMSEPITTLMLLGAFLAAMLVTNRRGALGLAAGAGALFGLAVLERVNALLYLPLYTIYIWQKCARRKGAAAIQTRTVPWRVPLAFLAGTVPFLAAEAFYNWYRFGGVARTGYHAYYHTVADIFRTPPWFGASGLLFSPGRGLVWFWPLLIIAVWLWPRFWRQHRQEGAFIAAFVIVNLLFFGAFTYWEGGTFRGPRFLLPTLPFLVLVLTEAKHVLPQERRWWRLAFGAAAGVIVFTQLLEVLLAPIQVIADWRERHFATLTQEQVRANISDVWSWETMPPYAEIMSLRRDLSSPSPAPPGRLQYPHHLDPLLLKLPRQRFGTKIPAALGLVNLCIAAFAAYSLRSLLQARPRTAEAAAPIRST